MNFFEIAEEKFLFQVIKSPTRFRGGNNPSILDLTFTKYPDDVLSAQMLAPRGKSDHVVILLELQIKLLYDKQLPSIKEQEDSDSLRLPRWQTGIKFRHWKASPTCGIRLGTGSWI